MSLAWWNDREGRLEFLEDMFGPSWRCGRCGRNVGFFSESGCGGCGGHGTWVPWGCMVLEDLP